MIITRTPFRISFFGGGTDYPAWFREHGGSVLATSIDKYCYISVRYLPPFFEHKHRIVYSRIETVKRIDELQHPAVKAVFGWAGVERGLEVHHDGDLPARSGMGSSSSFTVGLLQAVASLAGRRFTKQELARNAIHIEQNIIQEQVGSQDQVAAAFGGLNRINFERDDSFTVEPIILPAERLHELHRCLMLCFTGFSRYASTIAESKIANFKQRGNELSTMQRMVDQGIKILQDPDTPMDEFGRLLHESWQLKRGLSTKVSNPAIDQLYNKAITAGATGGKILGAGGGGFMLFFARPDKQPAVKAALSDLIHVPFNFDHSGSQVVLYQPNGF